MPPPLWQVLWHKKSRACYPIGPTRPQARTWRSKSLISPDRGPRSGKGRAESNNHGRFWVQTLHRRPACGSRLKTFSSERDDFHALGITLASKKPVFIADPEKSRAAPYKKDRQTKCRQGMRPVAKAMDANRIGVIMTKVGRPSADVARQMKKRPRTKGGARSCLQ
jgi:hypothetical protein